MNRIKFFPVSLGCVKNQVDFEYLFSQLKKFDWEKVNNVDKSDVVVINTCTFIRDAQEESINEILSYSLENKKLIVTGCLSQMYKEKLQKLFPEVEIFIGTESGKFAKEIDKMFRNKQKGVLVNNSCEYNEFPDRDPINKFHTYIKISEGCDRKCSFCLIPQIRGKYRSRKIDNIIKEVKDLYKKGFREFNIISEDTSLYGIDLYGKREIVHLIKELDRLRYRDIYFRLLYVYPDENVYEIIDVISKSKHFIKYIDVPLQHISKKILKKMGRVYIDAYKFAKYVKMKNLILRSSFIVGFPNETEKDFLELYNFIKEGFIDKLGIFTYSRQENTKSYNFNNRIHYKTAEKRRKLLFQLQEDIVYEKMKKYIGENKKAVLYEYDNENKEYYGRLLEDMYDIDNILIIKNNKKYKLFTEIEVNIKKIDNMAYYV